MKKNIVEVRQAESFIEEGQQLSGLLNKVNLYTRATGSQVIVPIASKVDNWLERSLSFMYSHLPKAIIDADLIQVSEICEKRKMNDWTQISLKDDVAHVLSGLQACVAFYRWLAEFELDSLNWRQKAIYNFKSLEAIVTHVQGGIVPFIIGLEDGETRKTAILHLFGRMHLLASGVAKLNEERCYQLLTSALRSMLELCIDFVLIDKNLIDNGVKKFFTFDALYRLRSAQRSLQIDCELKVPEKESSAVMSYINSNKEKQKYFHSLWGEKAKPKHWTDLVVEERARRAGHLELYRNIYYHGNMSVHSGYMSFPNSEDEAHLMCAHVYSSISQMLKDASIILSDRVDLREKDSIKQEIEKIYLFVGHWYIWKCANSNTQSK